MFILHFIFTVLFFVLLSPGILVRLPKKGTKMIVALVHGLIFAFMINLIHYFIKWVIYREKTSTSMCFY